MKQLLVLLISAYTANIWADGWKDYAFESVSCSTGAEIAPESSLILEAEFDLVQLSQDNSRLEYEQKVDSKVQKVSFKLNQVGKKSFMALPAVITPGEMTQFFVNIEDDGNDIELSRSDLGSKICGGGLIIKTFSMEAKKKP